MSIFDNFLSVKESEKVKTLDQSRKLIEEHMGKDIEILDFSSHREYSRIESRKKVFQFTVKLLSLDFLNKLGKDKRVKNVYFASRHAHPGGGADSISLRQKILIEYY